MGSPVSEPGRLTNETLHEVVLTQGFYMSKYEVTEKWWSEVMSGPETESMLPKNYVSWDMAVAFCNELSRREDLRPAYVIRGGNGNVEWDVTANGYRLPTEAEWEYAARAGSRTAFATGPLINTGCDPVDSTLDAIGWYCGNTESHAGPARVGLKQSNAWGLYDMHGNLWEMVWDGYGKDYDDLDIVDPRQNAGVGAIRVIKGGAWGSIAARCRSASRFGGGAPVITNDYQGFRPVRSVF